MKLKKRFQQLVSLALIATLVIQPFELPKIKAAEGFSPIIISGSAVETVVPRQVYLNTGVDPFTQMKGDWGSATLNYYTTDGSNTAVALAKDYYHANSIAFMLRSSNVIYNDTNAEVTWANSTGRSNVNGTNFMSAFGSVESSLLSITKAQTTGEQGIDEALNSDAFFPMSASELSEMGINPGLDMMLRTYPENSLNRRATFTSGGEFGSGSNINSTYYKFYPVFNLDYNQVAMTCSQRLDVAQGSFVETPEQTSSMNNPYKIVVPSFDGFSASLESPKALYKRLDNITVNFSGTGNATDIVLYLVNRENSDVAYMGSSKDINQSSMPLDCDTGLYDLYAIAWNQGDNTYSNLVKVGEVNIGYTLDLGIDDTTAGRIVQTSPSTDETIYVGNGGSFEVIYETLDGYYVPETWGYGVSNNGAVDAFQKLYYDTGIKLERVDGRTIRVSTDNLIADGPILNTIPWSVEPLKEAKGTIEMENYIFGTKASTPKIVLNEGHEEAEPVMEYWQGTKSLGANPPAAVGEYKVTATYPADYETGYDELVLEDTFSISYEKIQGEAYTLDGMRIDNEVWSDQVIHIQPPAGYQIALKDDTVYKDVLDITKTYEANTLGFRLKNKTTGGLTDVLYVKEKIGIDQSAPIGEIRYAIGNTYKDFVRRTVVSMFAKEPQIVTLYAEDESAVTAYNYVVTNSSLMQDEGITVEALEQKVSALGGWKTYTGPFTLTDKNKYFVYAKFLDPFGNATYVSSEGLVIYAPASLNQTMLSYEQKSGAKIALAIDLQGNQLVGITEGSKALRNGTDYTVVGNELVFANAYLDQCLVGKHQYTLNYCPDGVNASQFNDGAITFTIQIEEEVAPKIDGLLDGMVYYGDQVEFNVNTRRIRQVVVDGEKVDLAKGVISFTSDQGKKQYVVEVTDKNNQQATYKITVAAEWMRTMEIPNGKNVRLDTLEAYQLGSGNWKVAGDTTVYQGGVTFYVDNSGKYIFNKQ